MEDLRAVMDVVDSQRAVLAGYSEGGPMCLLFASTWPERTRALVTIGSYARRRSAPDYPFGLPPAADQHILEMIRHGWGGPMDIDIRAPTLAADPRFCRWWARYLRSGASPASILALHAANSQIDVRPLLASIQVPTLVLHATHDQTIPVESSRYLVTQIPEATLVEMDCRDHLPFGDGADQILAEISRFVTGTGTGEGRRVDRVISTVMFTDIVDSTRLAATLGDLRWRDLLQTHHETVRRELAIHRGHEVKTTGDGFHATFDGPARAIRCARAIQHSVADIGIDIRVGIHTGECELIDGEVEGLAVHIAARVSGLAATGEVLVSRTVRDLVAGAGFAFEDRGDHALRGIPDSWRIYSVT